jgi:hypothetical protein
VILDYAWLAIRDRVAGEEIGGIAKLDLRAIGIRLVDV